jgi:hypothetical protein
MWSVHTQIDDLRRDKRIDAISIDIELEEKFFTTLDWSLGGFLIDRYEGRRRPGDEITISLYIRVGDHTYEHVARAGVVRFVPGKNQLACRFLSLDMGTISTLEGHMTGRLKRRKPGAAKSGGEKKRIAKRR